MRVSRQQAAQNRERIVDAAGRLVREKGIEGAGLADIMRAVGLTHGGFYGHFASKDQLVSGSLASALAESAGRWRARVARDPEHGLEAIVRQYVSRRHCDDRSNGCLVVALGAEAARQTEPVRHALTEGVRALTDVLADALPPSDAPSRRTRALATFAGIVGAAILARAVDDPVFADEILAAAEASFSGGAVLPAEDRAASRDGRTDAPAAT